MSRLTLFRFTLLLSILHAHVLATEYFVSVSGSDGSDGKASDRPFKTLGKAAGLVNPGDTVSIMNGVYDSVYLSRSGTSDAWISWKAWSDHRPEIRFNGWSGIDVKASYQSIEGLTITGNNDSVTLAQAEADALNSGPDARFNGNGLVMDGRGVSAKYHHLIVRGCTIRKCGGGGVGVIQGDYVTIEDNKVYENAWYSRYAASGLSLYQSWNYDQQNTYRMIIRRNVTWNNRSLVKWTATNNYSDGNGIIIDDTKNTQNSSTLGKYSGRTLVSDNVSFNNGGSGMHSYASEHVDIVNNTSYNNGQKVGYPEIFSGDSSDVRIINNIMYARNGGDVNATATANVTYDYNLYFNATPKAQGANDIIADPKFVTVSNDQAVADFRLQAGSPALDNGTAISNVTSLRDIAGTNRPQGSGIDRGAYERAGNTSANVAPTISVDVLANVTVNNAVTLTASASDSDGSIAKVEFLVGTTVIATQTSAAPYGTTWTPSATGAFSITARATDNGGSVTTSSAKSVNVTAAVISTTLRRINAGGLAVGNFEADAGADGGTVYSTSKTIDISGVANAAPAAVYQTERYGAMTYTISGLTAGAKHTARLHFSETFVTGSGQRTFHVDINGNRVLTSFDIYATAGAGKAVVRDFQVTVSADSKVAIAFIAEVQSPKICAIELLDTPGTTEGAIQLRNSSFDENGYFSQNPVGWTTWSDIGSENADYAESHGGSRNDLFHGTHWQDRDYRVYTFQTVTGIANGTYVLSVWTRRSGAQSACVLAAKFYGDSDRYADIPVSSGESWIQVQIPNLVITNGQCEFGVWSDAHANEWVYFEDFELLQQSPAAPAGNG